MTSGSLTASGEDAFFDAILSSAVLLSAAIYMTTKIRLEAWVSVVISAFIIKSGIEMLLDAADEILGKRAEPEFIREIKRTICEDPAVLGAFDLILHSYGPEKYIGSVHVEVPDTMTAGQIDEMERRIAENVLMTQGGLLGGIGIYSRNTTNDTVRALRSNITHMVTKYDGVLQIHGFYLNEETKTLNFDVILDYALKNREEIFNQICDEVHAAYPDYRMQINMDIDI